MAEGRWASASVRLRTTAVAVAVVALALVLGALALVFLVRGSLHEGVETTAEQRAAALAEQVETSGLPEMPGSADDGEDDIEEDDEPRDLVWQLVGTDGRVVRASQATAVPLPTDDADRVRLPGAEDPYVVATEDAREGEYVVVVAVSLEEVAEATSALLTPLAVGLPLVLLLVGATTWLVVTRALAPVERIRAEVDEITGDRLDRRVPEPPSRDEIHRLAQTMNRMLGRLQDSRDRQQRFVADASHELRSPLASIRQTAEVSRAHPDALPEGELSEVVLAESLRMQRLVEQMLLLTREGVAGGTMQEVDVDDLALTEAARIRRTGLAVATDAVAPGRVHADAVALAQVVRNLVDNAARHAGSRLALGVTEVGAGQAGAGEAGVVELVVEDDGAGVPEADRQRIFERFVRLDEARTRDAGGSGLGLAIVAEIVTAHGGTVVVTTSSLGGARFVVRLPAGEPRRVAPS